MLTREEILTQLYNIFFIKKAAKSVTNNAMCKYDHSVNDYGCAIGCFMEPKIAKKFQTRFENKPIQYVAKLDKTGLPKYIKSVIETVEIDYKFWCTCQWWHDHYTQNIYKDFEYLCTIFNINIDEVKAAAETWEIKYIWK